MRAGPTSRLLLWALGGREELRESPSFPVSPATKKMEALGPPDWRGALSEEVIFGRERNSERRADWSAKRKGWSRAGGYGTRRPTLAAENRSWAGDPSVSSRETK